MIYTTVLSRRSLWVSFKYLKPSWCIIKWHYNHTQVGKVQFSTRRFTKLSKKFFYTWYSSMQLADDWTLCLWLCFFVVSFCLLIEHSQLRNNGKMSSFKRVTLCLCLISLRDFSLSQPTSMLTIECSFHEPGTICFCSRLILCSSWMLYQPDGRNTRCSTHPPHEVVSSTLTRRKHGYQDLGRSCTVLIIPLK